MDLDLLGAAPGPRGCRLSRKLRIPALPPGPGSEEAAGFSRSALGLLVRPSLSIPAASSGFVLRTLVLLSALTGFGKFFHIYM